MNKKSISMALIYIYLISLCLHIYRVYPVMFRIESIFLWFNLNINPAVLCRPKGLLDNRSEKTVSLKTKKQSRYDVDEGKEALGC